METDCEAGEEKEFIVFPDSFTSPSPALQEILIQKGLPELDSGGWISEAVGKMQNELSAPTSVVKRNYSEIQKKAKKYGSDPGAFSMFVNGCTTGLLNIVIFMINCILSDVPIEWFWRMLSTSQILELQAFFKFSTDGDEPNYIGVYDFAHSPSLFVSVPGASNTDYDSHFENCVTPLTPYFLAFKNPLIAVYQALRFIALSGRGGDLSFCSVQGDPYRPKCLNVKYIMSTESAEVHTFFCMGEGNVFSKKHIVVEQLTINGGDNYLEYVCAQLCAIYELIVGNRFVTLITPTEKRTVEFYCKMNMTLLKMHNCCSRICEAYEKGVNFVQSSDALYLECRDLKMILYDYFQSSGFFLMRRLHYFRVASKVHERYSLLKANQHVFGPFHPVNEEILSVARGSMKFWFQYREMMTYEEDEVVTYPLRRFSGFNVAILKVLRDVFRSRFCIYGPREDPRSMRKTLAFWMTV